MVADPFRRPSMVDIPAEYGDTMWQRWTQHLAEKSLWRGAKTFADLCELSAQFCEGKLSKTPDHGGPRCDETVRIGGPLAHANRQGFLTTGSQPGEDVPLYHGSEPHGVGQQRAAVEGWAHADTADQLRRLYEGTRIQVRVSQRRKWRADYSQVVNVSRYVAASGDVHEETHFGFVPAETTHFIDLGRADLTEGAVYVTVYDPLWGDHDLLWRRLSAPDWDNPPPPDEDRTMPTHIPPGREDLYRRQAEADAEVKRLTDLYEVATRKADRLNQRYPAYSPQVREADAEAERINTEVDRAEAVAERINEERTAGLSYWIDELTHLPICSACDGAGCANCSGWGREDDGTPTPPVWHEESQEWIDPATGRSVNPPAVPAPRDDDTQPDTQGATDMHMPGSATATTIADRWDQFFTWLFKGWGYDTTARPNSPHAIKARVDAKLAAWNTGGAAIKLAPIPEPEPPQDATDTRPQPQPQDLDNLPAPPQSSTRATFQPPPSPRLNAWHGCDPRWCSCENHGHDTRERAAATETGLNATASFLPPPRHGAKPAPPNNN